MRIFCPAMASSDSLSRTASCPTHALGRVAEASHHRAAHLFEVRGRRMLSEPCHGRLAAPAGPDTCTGPGRSEHAHAHTHDRPRATWLVCQTNVARTNPGGAGVSDATALRGPADRPRGAR